MAEVSWLTVLLCQTSPLSSIQDHCIKKNMFRKNCYEAYVQSVVCAPKLTLNLSLSQDTPCHGLRLKAAPTTAEATPTSVSEKYQVRSCGAYRSSAMIRVARREAAVDITRPADRRKLQREGLSRNRMEEASV